MSVKPFVPQVTMIQCYKHVLDSIESVCRLVRGSGDTSFHLNEHQCQILVEELVSTRVFLLESDCSTFVEGAICVSVQHLCFAVKRVEVLVIKCCCKDSESWLVAAMTMVEIQEECMEIVLDLHLWRMLLKFAITSRKELSQEEKVEEMKIMDETYYRLSKDLRLKSHALQQAVVKDKTATILNSSRIAEIHGSNTCVDSLRSIYMQSWLSGVASNRDLELTKWEYVDLLGQGGCGVVNKVRWLGFECALKMLGGQDEKEATALKGLFHPNIIRLLYYWEDRREDPQSRLLMELMPKDLGGYMKDRMKMASSLKLREGKDSMLFSLPVAIDVMYQIANAMRYMHDGHLVHRDLKPSNILVKERLTCNDVVGYLDIKLADFGLVKAYNSTSTFAAHSGSKGTAHYRAPEMFEKNMSQKIHYLQMADVWSFGITCVEILSGKDAYAKYVDEYGLTIQSKICKKGLRPTMPRHCPEYLSFCIKSCWEHSPIRRPTFSSLCKLLRHAKLLSLGVTHLDDSKLFFAYSTRSGQVKSLNVSSRVSNAIAVNGDIVESIATLDNSVGNLQIQHSEKKNKRIGGVFATFQDWFKGRSAETQLPSSRKAASTSDPSPAGGLSPSIHGIPLTKPRAPPLECAPGPSPGNLLLAVSGVQSSVSRFAKLLILGMDHSSRECLMPMIIREVRVDMDRTHHWEYLVQGFIYKRLFDGFDAASGYFGISVFENDPLPMTKPSSFADFSKFKDRKATISRLMDSDSPDHSSLGRFCFQKFKSIFGVLAVGLRLPLFEETCSEVEKGCHPKMEFYRLFLEAAVAVWLLHRLVGSFEETVVMLIYEKGSKFQRQTMESVVPGSCEEIAFSLIPGFQVSGRVVVKCEVYPRPDRHTKLKIADHGEDHNREDLREAYSLRQQPPPPPPLPGFDEDTYQGRVAARNARGRQLAIGNASVCHKISLRTLYAPPNLENPDRDDGSSSLSRLDRSYAIREEFGYHLRSPPRNILEARETPVK